MQMIWHEVKELTHDTDRCGNDLTWSKRVNSWHCSVQMIWHEVRELTHDTVRCKWSDKVRVHCLFGATTTNKQTKLLLFKSRDVRCFSSQFRVNDLINFLLHASNQTGHYTVISGPVPKNEFPELTSCSVNWSDTTGESEKCRIIQCL